MKIDNTIPTNSINSFENNPQNGESSARKLQASPVEQTQKQEQPKQEDLVKVLDLLKEKFNDLSEVGFEYLVDKETNRSVVQIYDKSTREVIRQYPPKEILSMLEKMAEMMGFLVDQKA